MRLLLGWIVLTVSKMWDARKYYSKRLSRVVLDQMGRAIPTSWARFQTASIIIKAVIRERPIRLNSYIERRRPDRYRFFSNESGWICDERIGLWLDNGTEWWSNSCEPEEIFWFGQGSGWGFFPLGWGAKCQGQKSQFFLLSIPH